MPTPGPLRRGDCANWWLRVGPTTSSHWRKARPSDGPVVTPFSELGAAYMEHAREYRGLKEGTTLTDYARTIRNQGTPFFGEAPIQQIDARRIEAFARHLRAKKELRDPRRSAAFAEVGRELSRDRVNPAQLRCAQEAAGLE